MLGPLRNSIARRGILRNFSAARDLEITHRLSFPIDKGYLAYGTVHIYS